MPETLDRALPPTQDLIMEVLAARARLGHRTWTFGGSKSHYNIRDALAHLDGLGLVRYKSGVEQWTYLAWLTDKGKDIYLTEGYVPPIHGGDEGGRMVGRRQGDCCHRAYTCPSSGDRECLEHGGFDNCCKHPGCPGNLDAHNDVVCTGCGRKAGKHKTREGTKRCPRSKQMVIGIERRGYWLERV